MRIDALRKKIGKKFRPEDKKPQRLTENKIARIMKKYKISESQVAAKVKELNILKRSNTKIKVKKTSKKMRRVQKLIDNWNALETKMIGYVRNGISKSGMSERARLAYGVLLMMETGIRTGNEGSAEGYICNNKHIKEFGKTIRTYGLTTIQIDHTETNSTTIFLNFTGKKGVNNILDTAHPTLRKYYDVLINKKKPSDRLLNIDYKSLKKFVRSSVGSKFTPKDIRTAAVNLKFIDKVLAMAAKGILKPVSKKGEAKRILNSIIEYTADEIGHTKSVCRGAYLSPALVLHVEQSLYKPKEKESRLRKEKVRVQHTYRPV